MFSGLKVDPEWLHGQFMATLTWLEKTGDRLPAAWLVQRLHQVCCTTHPALRQQLWGLDFDNPVGLAAGFDKDGMGAALWSDFGFGFAELGTVTLHAQPGNPLPRLFRLPQDQAALNRMGFNNRGAAALAARLEQLTTTPSKLKKSSPSPASFPLGINLGKSKVTPLDLAADDYLGSFRLLKELGDYFVVNVSSPNTPGLRSLQDASQLDQILAVIQHENTEHKPLLVKIAPDLDWEAIADIIKLAQTHHLAGIIATNTTIRRDGLNTHLLPGIGTYLTDEPGGISGAPLRQRATEVIRFIYQKTAGTLPIIGVGGIFTADDAWEKITAGASLLQVYTGWMYEGPQLVPHILTGLAQKLTEHGMSHIRDAVGSSAQ